MVGDGDQAVLFSQAEEILPDGLKKVMKAATVRSSADLRIGCFAFTSACRVGKCMLPWSRRDEAVLELLLKNTIKGEF